MASPGPACGRCFASYLLPSFGGQFASPCLPALFGEPLSVLSDGRFFHRMFTVTCQLLSCKQNKRSRLTACLQAGNLSLQASILPQEGAYR